jgi:hypothetical protein
MLDIPRPQSILGACQAGPRVQSARTVLRIVIGRNACVRHVSEQRVRSLNMTNEGPKPT